MIDRESIIEMSVVTFLRTQLFDVRGYTQEDGGHSRRSVQLLDKYPDNERMSKPLDRNYIAIGWSADDGGRQAELGSPLKERKYTFDFYTFGISRVWGKNLASVIRYSLESDQVIDLLDPVTSDVMGHVDVDFVASQQQVTSTPRPWEENVWVTRLRVIDYYSSASGG
jgi:hypothetical protein